ncbi:thermonuclease family protein [Phyllobacterium salinisoli]|uniref:Thermonuclease family protein n=1 Tax=Phyllobacterium salinisoli TaxID=1899321 RepID=A0A368K8F1_9HYPH|nr:thermonuclease family protein [Phyllobacterium salinisoli]RCS24692.1 thermonuclease family protein [Phyllobacterium salinisoli]
MAGQNLAPLVLAAFVACVLVSVFVAPSYGLLDHSGGTETSQAILTENFELPEDGEAVQPTEEISGSIAEKEQPAARPAAPGFALPQDYADEPLERIDPRPPLSELSLALPPRPQAAAADPGEIRYRLLHRPLATAAGRIEADGHVVEVQGIVIPSPDETCTDPAGVNWPCGMQARTAFRAWLRSRAVMCRLPATPSSAVSATDCTLGGEDVAAWLVGNGWARAKADGPYAERARKAEERQVGIFGRRPDSALPAFSVSMPPSPEPLPR